MRGWMFWRPRYWGIEVHAIPKNTAMARVTCIVATSSSRPMRRLMRIIAMVLTLSAATWQDS